MRATLPGSPLAPGSARGLVREELARWCGREVPGAERVTDRLREDAMVVVSELVTNAVVHAGTDVHLLCRLEESGSLVVEVGDQHPARAPREHAGDTPCETPEYGRGLRIVATLAECWGVTYRRGAKTVWARLPAEPPAAEVRGGDAPAEGVLAGGVLGGDVLGGDLPVGGVLGGDASAGDLLAGVDALGLGVAEFLAPEEEPPQSAAPSPQPQSQPQPSLPAQL
ncbi:ATP-binding protein, partial [Streptomyces mangrovisoli]|uniref:ATP-binding protein n=1 Tax=Streptomyces mangrovisoli TaxID=1428628 RepID=UPI003B84A497